MRLNVAASPAGFEHHGVQDTPEHFLPHCVIALWCGAPANVARLQWRTIFAHGNQQIIRASVLQIPTPNCVTPAFTPRRACLAGSAAMAMSGRSARMAGLKQPPRTQMHQKDTLHSETTLHEAAITQKCAMPGNA